jgi:hypothetical protein
MSRMKEYLEVVKQAARVYRKLYALRIEGWSEGEHCDRQFDAGEWSGPAWGEAFEIMERKTIRDVAKKFDVRKKDLRHIIARNESNAYYS